MWAQGLGPPIQEVSPCGLDSLSSVAWPRVVALSPKLYNGWHQVFSELRVFYSHATLNMPSLV